MYQRLESDYGISVSLAVLSHTAYHLGGIRQAVSAIRAVKGQAKTV